MAPAHPLPIISYWTDVDSNYIKSLHNPCMLGQCLDVCYAWTDVDSNHIKSVIHYPGMADYNVGIWNGINFIHAH